MRVMREEQFECSKSKVHDEEEELVRCSSYVSSGGGMRWSLKHERELPRLNGGQRCTSTTIARQAANETDMAAGYQTVKAANEAMPTDGCTT